jgi:hypothetical protein
VYIVSDLSAATVGVCYCPSGCVLIGASPGMPSLVCAVVSSISATYQIDCTVLQKCLPLCLPSQLYMAHIRI